MYLLKSLEIYRLLLWSLHYCGSGWAWTLVLETHTIIWDQHFYYGIQFHSEPCKTDFWVAHDAMLQEFVFGLRIRLRIGKMEEIKEMLLDCCFLVMASLTWLVQSIDGVMAMK